MALDKDHAPASDDSNDIPFTDDAAHAAPAPEADALQKADPAKGTEAPQKADTAKEADPAQKPSPELLMKEVQAPLSQLTEKIMEEFNVRLQGIQVPGNLGRNQPGQLLHNSGGQSATPGYPSSVRGGAASVNENVAHSVDGQSHLSQADVIYQNIFHLTVGGELEKRFKAGEALGVSDQDTTDYVGRVQNTISKAPDSTSEKIRGEIQSGSGGAAYVISSKDRTGTGSGKLPESDVEIEVWYHQLNQREQCFVRAAAALHGAPLSAIAKATNELYLQATARIEAGQPAIPTSQPTTDSAPTPATFTETLSRFFLWIHQEEQMRIAPASSSTNPPVVSTPDSAPIGSTSDLLERTHLYTRRVNGATRLFWQDANEASGLSRFSTELLRFFSREVSVESIYAQPGQSFLNIIKQWPEKYQGELSWRSANAMGVIWWYQDARTLLWTQATEWAKSSRRQDWEHAAALLDGAFRVEQDVIWNDAESTLSSSVIQLLNQWTNVAHQATTRRGEGYATARAYALIGRKYPEVALKGLQRLLSFPIYGTIRPEVAEMQQDLFIAGVFKYIDIVRSGHIRQVLAHLANSIDQPANGHITFTSTDIRRDRVNAQQSTTDLHVILAAFMLVSSCSLSGANPQIRPSYSSTETLPDLPDCPSHEGKDVLLAGLLTEAEQPAWQRQLAILVGALLMEKNDEAAFYLLRRWGEIVLKDDSPEANSLQDAYSRFLIEIGQKLHIWLSERNSTRFFALGVYKRKLRLWLTDKRLFPHDKFQRVAEHVLTQLP
jgi:hypothetical protein